MKKLIILSLISFVFTGCGIWPPYRVWEQRQEGEADYAKAESTRKIAVLEAQAALESAKLKAQAEIERAKGVAEANKIIGTSLHNNEVYLKYLWVTNMTNNQKETVYIPTEANIPILEAGKTK